MFKLALKNILFYKGRSIATAVLTFASTMLFILFVSLQDGSHNSMLENSLKIYTGAIEIYRKGYRDIGGNEYLIQDAKAITDKLENIDAIEAYSPRYETYGLLSNKEYSAASMVAGIEPDKERLLSSLESALIEGSFLAEGSNCIYMGAELLKKLKLGMGGEVAFIGSASNGSFAADMFRVCGVFKTGSFEFDSTASFVARSYFDELMNAKNRASYITLKLRNIEDAQRVNEQIISMLDNENLESLTWKTLMKNMVEIMEIDAVFGYISLSLFMVVIFFVIMIYGFVNVSSRIKEFGVLRCIGLSKRDVFLLLFYEIALLTIFATLLATPIAAYICYYYNINPIVIEGIADMYKEYGIVSDEIPFAYNPFTIGWNVGVIYLLNFLSILYPYMFINSFRPIEATRHV